MNNRRKLVFVLGAGALTAPFGSYAQQPGKPAEKIWRVGFLATPNRPASIDSDITYAGLLRGLRELGYVEGRNLSFEWRFAHNQPELLAPLAAELARLNVDVIVTMGSPATLAAQKATTTIPIVFVGPGDVVGSGLVKSLARPGGNTTGMSSMMSELNPKRLQMLLEMTAAASPKVTRVAYLLNPNTPNNIRSFDGTFLAAAQKLGVELRRSDARTPQEIENGFSAMKRDKVAALLVSLDPFFEQQRSQIGELSLKHRIACMTADPVYAEAGCLMSYGTRITAMFHRASSYVDKIFKGAKPADLPVEQPTRLELVINGRTAKALGLNIPQSLLISTDRVIE
ncbi:MAG: ABC transporter substrate-binding protein [Betaproteobacteria bacterium]|nr:ABC transporter substrate-binding protein [Betaproteobacteria bacterium]